MVAWRWQSRHHRSSSPGSAIRSASVGGPVIASPTADANQGRTRLAALTAQAEHAPPEDRARLEGTMRVIARAVEAGREPPGP
jgi:hypothetical protein